MSNRLDKEMIEHVSILAKLDLTETEQIQAGADIEQMLDYIDKLKELDTAEIEPMPHIFPVRNVFREDEVVNADASEAMLRNAPNQSDGQYQVPKTVE